MHNFQVLRSQAEHRYLDLLVEKLKLARLVARRMQPNVLALALFCQSFSDAREPAV